jgi:hypothetical protein
MPYIGKIPAIGNYQVLDTLTASATATYALTKGGVAVFPQTPANCIVSLNGVIQAPFDSYTISGSNIVFASALTGSDSIDFITVLGDVLNVGTVSDNTITTAKLADSSVSLAKLTATGTKDATTFLRGDNTFASAGGTNTPAFLIKQTFATSLANATRTKVNLDVSDIDTDSGLDATNKRWIVPSGKGGKYQLFYQLRFDSAADFDNCNVLIYKNGSAIVSSWGTNLFYSSFGNSFIADLSVGDYLELFALHSQGGSVTASTSDFGLQTYLGGYKLIT